MQKYSCNVCGYTYDPAVGDQETKVEPETPFEKLPNDWVCPICGVDKKEFTISD